MRLYEKFRPRKLSEIVGQPAVRILQRLAIEPYSCAILLEGPPGVGKTASAFALAHELGCFNPSTWPNVNPPNYHIGRFTGLFDMTGADLSIEEAKDLFNRKLRTRYGSDSGFVVLILDELERLSKECQGFMRKALEHNLPRNVIVIGTSNKADGLGDALLQRFRRYQFRGGLDLLQAAHSLLADIWAKESNGAPPPSQLASWGFEDGSYSLRNALTEMQDYVELTCV